MYLSVLKRSIWNSILTGLIPCAREKCCKEEPGKPLGPYFPFLSDNWKGRVSDTDFTLHLHFWSAPALSPSDLLVTQPQFWTLTRGKEHPTSSHEKLEHHIWKNLVFISNISCNSAWFYFETWFYQSHKFFLARCWGGGMLRFLDRSTLLQVDLALQP